MTSPRLVLLATAMLLTAGAAVRPGRAQTVFLADTTKVAIIRQLLAKTGAVDQALAMMEANVQAQRAANPRIPAVFWDRFVEQARARRGELAELMTTAYVSYFTAEDLRQLLAFYDSPIGAKLLSVQPELTRQSLAAGQRWGSLIGADVARKLAAEGVKVEP